jgi:hypothetical protein
MDDPSKEVIDLRTSSMTGRGFAVCSQLCMLQ